MLELELMELREGVWGGAQQDPVVNRIGVRRGDLNGDPQAISLPNRLEARVSMRMARAH